MNWNAHGGNSSDDETLWPQSLSLPNKGSASTVPSQLEVYSECACKDVQFSSKVKFLQLVLILIFKRVLVPLCTNKK